MFTEMKNQMFLTWNIDFGEASNDNIADADASGSGVSNNTTNNNDSTPTGDDANGMNNVTNPSFTRSLSGLSNLMFDTDTSANPFVSRQVVMVLAQRIMKDANNANLTLNDISAELDSLNACLNVIRFLLLKDKETNRTNIFDEDCPLRGLLAKLNDKLNMLLKELGAEILQNRNEANSDNSNVAAMKHFEISQKERMRTYMLLTMDILKIVLKNYTFSYSQAKQPPAKVES